VAIPLITAILGLEGAVLIGQVVEEVKYADVGVPFEILIGGQVLSPALGTGGIFG